MNKEVSGAGWLEVTYHQGYIKDPTIPVGANFLPYFFTSSIFSQNKARKTMPPLLRFPMLLLWLGILAAAAAPSPSSSSSSDGSSRKTAQYKQAISHGEAALAELLKTHPDITVDNPKEEDDELVTSSNQYIFDPPPTNDYVVGMLVNPMWNKWNVWTRR